MAWRHTWSFVRRRRLAGSGLLAVALAALFILSVAAGAESPRTEGSGIGGTGHLPGEGNGIGGTGGPQGRNARATGVVGTVTGFGSIFVNGFEIDYSPETKTESDIDEPLDAKAIGLGQVVEVEAYGEGKRLHARKIAVRYEVRGPIETIDRASGQIRVLGQTVAAAQSLVATPRSRAGSLSDLAVGDRVDVSGLRRSDAVIVASRIEKAAPEGRAWLRGRVESADSSGFTLNGLRIAAEGASRPVVGEEAAVLGAYSAGTFMPAKIIRLPKAPFAGRVSYLSIEGFVRDRKGDGRFIGEVNIGEARAQNIRAGDRVVVDGKIGEGGRFIPAKVRPSQFDRAPPRQPGQAQPPRGHTERHDPVLAPARKAPGFFGPRGQRWTPHRESRREGTRWQNRASPRRGRKR